MVYEYKVIQTPPHIEAPKNEQMGQAAALYLEGLINRMAEDGWEFFRVDSMGVFTNPGCLASLSGQKQMQQMYYVVTFRRSKA